MIKDLSELAQFLKMCRKTGVRGIKFSGIDVTFGDLPKKQDASDEVDIPTEELTPEQLMFFSAGGMPP